MALRQDPSRVPVMLVLSYSMVTLGYCAMAAVGYLLYGDQVQEQVPWGGSHRGGHSPDLNADGFSHCIICTSLHHCIDTTCIEHDHTVFLLIVNLIVHL